MNILPTIMALIRAFKLSEIEYGPPNSTGYASSSVQLDCSAVIVTLVTFQTHYAINLSSSNSLSINY